MAVDIGPKIGIDGEAEFRKEISNITQQVKTFGSEMNAVTTEFGENQDSMKALKSQNEILSKSIDAQTQKLKKLQKGLEASAKEFGDNDTRTLKWQQAVNDATAELNRMENKLQDNIDAMKKAKQSASSFGDMLKASLAADVIVGAIKGIIDGFKQMAEESREYRKIMGSLEISSEQAGYSVAETSAAYKELYGVLADNQTAATTTANLQALGLAQDDLNTLIDGTIGAWAKYGDSIPIDGLAEAINETVKTGAVTGTFADVLNWAGTSEDKFNKKLEKASGSAERANLVLQELANQGLIEAGQKWQENNQSLVEANQATAEYEGTIASLGETVEPVLTAIQEGINGILGFLSSIASEIDFEEIAANIQSVTSFFLDLVNGVRSGSMSLGEAFLEIKRKAGELFYSLLEELKNSLPEILSIGMEMVQELISGIMSEAPGLIAEATELLASFLDELLSNLPAILETGGELLLMLVRGIVEAFPEIVSAAEKLIMSLIDSIIQNLPQILETGVLMIGELVAGIISAIPTVLGEIINMVINIGTQIKEYDWETIGGDVLRGLANGIIGFVGTVVDAAKAAAGKIASAFKDFFDIHSPSRVMRDEVGKQLTAGIAEGILANKDYATKSAEEVSSAILKAAQQKLDNHKVYNDLTLADEAAFWDEIRKQTKEGTQARVDADKKYLDAKKKLEDKLLDIEESYKDKVSQVYKDLNQNIKDAWDNYHAEVDSLTDSIKSQMSLFDRFESSTELTTKDLLDNLESQVDGLEGWQRSLRTLESRGVSDELLSELEDMGVSAAGEVSLLTQMTDEELDRYVDLWEEKNRLARAAATDQLEPLMESTRQQVAQLRLEAREELDKYKEEYVEAMQEVGAVLAQPIEAVNNKLVQTFTDMVSLLAGTMGAQSGSTENQAQYQQLVDNVVSSASGLPAEFQTIGNNTIDGIITGLQDGSGRLYQVMEEIIRQTIAVAQQAAEIHSPSVVMRDLIGKNMMAGLAVGLDEYKGLAANAASSAMQNVINAFSGYSVPQNANGMIAAYDRLSAQLSGMQVVLNDGTLVGKITPAIDNRMGFRSKIKGRYGT